MAKNKVNKRKFHNKNNYHRARYNSRRKNKNTNKSSSSLNVLADAPASGVSADVDDAVVHFAQLSLGEVDRAQASVAGAV